MVWIYFVMYFLFVLVLFWMSIGMLNVVICFVRVKVLMLEVVVVISLDIGWMILVVIENRILWSVLLVGLISLN